jgi:UDP-GlcNAc3NAcA epimerase
MIGAMLPEIDRVLAAENPRCVVVYGDTNTTLAGALAAKKRNIPLAHVEAGIRTGQESMPEESNRYLTDRMADLNFTCTYLGLENLRKEGFGGETISSKAYNTGDLMYDGALQFMEKNPKPAARAPTETGVEAAAGGPPFILATLHRAENTESIEKLLPVIRALNRLHVSMPVVFPMHPKTKQLLDMHQAPVLFTVIPPLGHYDMLSLLGAARAVITDSGGLSREAFFFNKPALVVMQVPFWPEIIRHGNCMQSAAGESEILEKTELLLASDKPFETGLFGDGHAAEKISEILSSYV